MLFSPCPAPFLETIEMGFTYLKVFVSKSLDFADGREVEFLVDTGAFYTMIPRETLEEIGIVPVMYRTFTLANSETIRRQVGGAYLRYKDQPGLTLVIFGEAGDKPLLGVLGLESMGYKINPIKGELEPIELLL
jgi:predicted aspartyl protease